MAEKTFLEITPDVHKSVVTHAHEDDRMTLVTEQDLDPVLRDVAIRRDVGKWDTDMKPVAEIPMVIVERMMRDGSWNDPAAIKRWLNDPQNDCFRIWRGRV